MRLSIITVNLNNREGLRRTMESVISQTWNDYEWIIIDGGSTDGSKVLIEEKQALLAYWCSESDRGVYHAMNKGIVKAKGTYLYFLNSGDVLYDKLSLEKVFQNVSSLYADVVYGNAMRIENKREKIWEFPSRVDLEFLCWGNICHQSMFIKSNLLKEKGYDESFKIYADWARWIQLYLDGRTFQYVPIVVCGYEMGGVSSNPKLKDEEYKRIIGLIPNSNLKEYLTLNYQYKVILDGHEKLAIDIIALMKERTLFKFLILGNVLFVKRIRKLLNLFIPDI